MNKTKKVNICNYEYLLFVDTETIGSLNAPDTIMPFEIGLKVYKNTEEEDETPQKQVSYLVSTFFNNKYVMGSSFSANKYGKYQELIENDKRYKVKTVKEISKAISSLIKKYNIKVMVAHNGQFDQDALARLFNEFGAPNPFANLDLLDTMEVSKIITYSIEYCAFCEIRKDVIDKATKESKFITNGGRVRTTAQAITCYLQRNTEYQEKHTALEDIDDEYQIYCASLARLGNTMVQLNTRPSYKDYSIVVEVED